MKTTTTFSSLVAAALLLAGCTATSIQFNYKPKAIELSSGDGGGNALVLGQAFMRGYGDWVQIFVIAVDETKTLSETKMRPDVNFLVPAGKHTLRVKAQIGNSMLWREADAPGVVAELAPGIAYQINARESTNIRGQAGVEVWIERIGTVEQYRAYLKKNPGLKQGQPLQALQLSGDMS